MVNMVVAFGEFRPQFYQFSGFGYTGVVVQVTAVIINYQAEAVNAALLNKIINVGKYFLNGYILGVEIRKCHGEPDTFYAELF
jgi:hypothetical protein